jgi:hypothetical protein
MAVSEGLTSEIGGRKLTRKSCTTRDLVADWKRWSFAERIVAAGIVFWLAAVPSLMVLKAF